MRPMGPFSGPFSHSGNADGEHNQSSNRSRPLGGGIPAAKRTIRPTDVFPHPPSMGLSSVNGPRRRIILPPGGLDGPFQSFRSFMLMQDDTIPPDVARTEFEKYKHDYETHQTEKCFERNKGLALMIERYHPNIVALQHEKQCLRSRINAEIFGEHLKNDIYSEIKYALVPEIPHGVPQDTDVSPLCWKIWMDTIDYPLNRNDGNSAPLFLQMPLENCLQIDNVLETITKWNIADALKELPGFVDVFVSNNLGNSRVAWCCFYNTEHRQAAYEILATTEKSVKEWQINVSLPEIPEIVRLGVAPPCMSHPQRILEDIVTSFALIQKFDEVYKVRGPEEEIAGNGGLLGDIFPIYSYFEAVVDPMERLDLQLFYLRLVHNICYYSGEHFSDELQAWKRRFVYVVRSSLPLETHASTRLPLLSEASEEQRLWMESLDSKLETLLNASIHIPEMLTENTPIVKAKWQAYCEEHTLADYESARCLICKKLFKTPMFVANHLSKKHKGALLEMIENVAQKMMFAAFRVDPQRSLFTFPPPSAEGIRPPPLYHGAPPPPPMVAPPHYGGGAMMDQHMGPPLTHFYGHGQSVYGPPKMIPMRPHFASRPSHYGEFEKKGRRNGFRDLDDPSTRPVVTDTHRSSAGKTEKDHGNTSTPITSRPIITYEDL
ncbi:hypothetical protein IE077_001229 [Cardiosporidium cionae]|uniref:C2H2-type domain-containing protein n=1 Tax=Cardiosporidium cionae TaxID=476202 RepID=A0ABQ7JDB2_9APIC|nr:hypothetical protein IE077_001229 [Cardiosporidium cionae]|eukprot:KAF8822012.1 hypothetical protein IE077_001229 [Cardiosporidium cionae]